MSDAIVFRLAGAGANAPLIFARWEEIHSPDGMERVLSREVAQRFVDAARDSGVPIDERVRAVMRMRKARPDLLEQTNILPAGCAVPAWTVDPLIDVYVEPFPHEPQPWPVFVAVGGDILAEFYPIAALEVAA